MDKRDFEKLIDEWKIGINLNGFENEFVAIPNAEREGFRTRLLGFEVENLRVLDGVKILWVENGSSGFEGFSRDGDSGYAAPDDAVPLEYLDFRGGSEPRRVFAEEMGDGGAADAGADYADGGRRWRWSTGVWLSLGERKKSQQQREYHHVPPPSIVASVAIYCRKINNDLLVNRYLIFNECDVNIMDSLNY